ncbi:MAG TPA: site-specific DNA-methyltransferase [Paludibacteraceae bacterium]|nr:site-specific DNA-methyltransferase [Paludibacteraceae bacterium]
MDVVFADPPYFLSSNRTLNISGRIVHFEKGEWDRCRNIDEIEKFNEDWICAVREKLKPNGTIWVTGTFHNIFSVVRTLQRHGFRIINLISWHKSNPRPIVDGQHFTFSTEIIVWARKSQHGRHYFNHELMVNFNGGIPMEDVWTIPTPEYWERRCGKHPTQKPLRLLHRIILASSRVGDVILDPFTGSCTTGIAANLLQRKFIGIDQNKDYLEIGIRRKAEITDLDNSSKMLAKLFESEGIPMVMVNHARRGLREKMIEQGICYLRAGDSKGSLLVKPGFERLQYVLLHTNGENGHIFKLNKKGCFQIWTKETLENYGFQPEHAPYYIVLHFDNKKEVQLNRSLNLKEYKNTYVAKIKSLSDFICVE